MDVLGTSEGEAARPASTESAVALSDELGDGFAWMIVELAPDGVVVSDDEGRILVANRQVEEMFGYDRAELLGASVEILVPEHQRSAHETHREAFVAAPAMRPMSAGLRLFGCHRDGSEFPIEVSLSPIASPRGIATVVSIRNVTEQYDLERVARAGLALDDHERIAAELHDRVIGHLFGSGLAIASILGRNTLDADIAERLHGIIDDLDVATREIRNTVFDGLGHQLGATSVA